MGGVNLLLCACLASAILGFLVFNAPFPQARIFMGDGGAYFLGFVLALLPLRGSEEGGGRLPVLYTAGVLHIPILDTTVGLSSRRVDAVLFTLQICLGGVLVYMAVKTPGYLPLVGKKQNNWVGIGFFVALHFLNRRALRVSAGGGIGVPWGEAVQSPGRKEKCTRQRSPLATG